MAHDPLPGIFQRDRPIRAFAQDDAPVILRDTTGLRDAH
jgi:hypothetical protein